MFRESSISNRRLRSPIRAAFVCATAKAPSARSIPTTSPRSPIAFAAVNAVRPVPVDTSSTVACGGSPAPATSWAANGANRGTTLASYGSAIREYSSTNRRTASSAFIAGETSASLKACVRQAFITGHACAAVVLRPKFQEGHVDVIRSFLRHHLRESGRKGFVLGMSGGIDSSLVAKLCADAVGPARVLGLALPETSGGADEADARAWARQLGIGFRALEIRPIVAAASKALRIARDDRVGLGNLKARMRMVALYQVARAEERLVIGAGNKSEIALGYFTKMGDGGCDFLPIGDLYKTQVREMARHLGLPPRMLDKVPSAGLWKGQTDEGELGIAYEDLDRILLGVEMQFPPEEIAARVGVDIKQVVRIERMVAANVHKRKMPLAPKIGIRTFGLDWRGGA